MANPAHVEIVRQGAAAIREWRRRFPHAKLDLRGADLHGVDLTQVELIEVNLNGANLSWAELYRADLRGASLVGANLTDASLVRATLDGADLTGSDLTGAQLLDTNLTAAVLTDTTLDGCAMGGTVLASTVLPPTQVGTIRHSGPSTVNHATLAASGMLPVAFLRSCGLPDELIQYYQSVYDKPIKRFSCFISYSTTDQSLANRLHADLDARGVRNWLATEDLKIGDRHRQVIEDQIRLHDKLLLVLSEHSVASQWVEREVLAALDREARTGETVLFPIRIDSAVFETEVQWASEIQRGRHIGDFTDWDSSAERYEAAFERVLRDLQPDR